MHSFSIFTLDDFSHLFVFSYHESVSSLIIYMKKFLHSDWLRAVQFVLKAVQKRVNLGREEETNQAF